MNQRTIVLITGTSSGFGRLMAETLARGAFRLKILELDVTNDESVESAVDTIIRETGRIDVVINNAGYTLYGLTEACTLQQAQRIFDTNFFGVLRMNRAVLPHMRRNGSGLLVHISSGAGRRSLPGLGLYSASKIALEALGEVYHYELASPGIDSVIIEPGAFSTAIFQKREEALDQERNSACGPASEIPRRVFDALASSKANPQDVADCIAQVVEMPPGARPLCLTVGLRFTDAIRGLNYLSQQFMKDFLEKTEIAHLTRFQTR